MQPFDYLLNTQFLISCHKHWYRLHLFYRIRFKLDLIYLDWKTQALCSWTIKLYVSLCVLNIQKKVSLSVNILNYSELQEFHVKNGDKYTQCCYCAYCMVITRGGNYDRNALLLLWMYLNKSGLINDLPDYIIVSN